MIGGEGGERILHPTDETLPSDIPTSELMADYIRKSLRSDGSAVGIKIMVELHQEEVRREDRAAQRREMELEKRTKHLQPVDEEDEGEEDEGFDLYLSHGTADGKVHYGGGGDIG